MRLRAPRTSVTCPLLALLLGAGAVTLTVSPLRSPTLASASDLTVTVVLSPSAVAADGKAASSARVWVTDAVGAPVSGQAVQLSTSGDATVAAPSGSTGSDGTYTSSITASTTPGAETITAAAGSATGSATLFEGPGWTQNTPALAPVWRGGQVMAYDAATRSVVLFGGINGDVFTQEVSNGLAYDVSPTGFNDTWTWDGAGWALQKPPAFPTGGKPLGMAYDASARRVVLFYGKQPNSETTSASDFTTETWLWDGSTWTLAVAATATTPHPSWRQAASMAYDPASGHVLLVGGETCPCPSSSLDETWSWDGSSWTQLSPARTPGTRFGAGLAYDVRNDRLLLFGGIDNAQNGTVRFGDTWAWDGSHGTWTLLSPPGLTPPARNDAFMVPDLATGTIALFGGTQADSSAADDDWVWNGSSWAQPAQVGPPPAQAIGGGSRSAAAAYDPDNETVVLTGGQAPASSALAGTPLCPTPVGDGCAQIVQTWTYLDASSVQVSVSPGSIPADGLATATATATVTGAGGHAATGDTVRFTSSGDAGLGPVANAHDGTYSVLVTGSRAVGTQTITATTDREAVAGSALLHQTPPATPSPSASPSPSSSPSPSPSQSSSPSPSPAPSPPASPTPSPSPTPAPGGCPPSPVGGGILYPAGYSLVGLPAGTRVNADSPLYSWSNQGRGGQYSAQDGAQPVAGGIGYWAWFACPHAVAMNGPGASTMAFPLGAYHASIVGNPSGTGPVTVSGFDFAAAWDPASGRYSFSGYRQPVRLGVGAAVWVFSYVATTVRIGP